DLVEPEPDAEDDHQDGGGGSSGDPGQVAEPDGVAVVGAEEPEVGAEQHHPLEADVEYAGALRDRLAERREHERDPVGESAGERARPEELGPDPAREDHAAAFLRQSGARSASLSPGVR